MGFLFFLIINIFWVKFILGKPLDPKKSLVNYDGLSRAKLTSLYGRILAWHVLHFVAWIWLSTVHVQLDFHDRPQGFLSQPNSLVKHWKWPNHLFSHSSNSSAMTSLPHFLQTCLVSGRFHSLPQHRKMPCFIVSLKYRVWWHTNCQFIAAYYSIRRIDCATLGFALRKALRDA